MSKKKLKKVDRPCTDCGKDCDPLLLYPLPFNMWQRKPDEKQLEREKAIRVARERGMPVKKKALVVARRNRKAELCPGCLDKWRKTHKEKTGGAT